MKALAPYRCWDCKRIFPRGAPVDVREPHDGEHRHRLGANGVTTLSYVVCATCKTIDDIERAEAASDHQT